MSDHTTPDPCICYDPTISGPNSLLYTWYSKDHDIITTYRFQYTQGGVSQTVDLSNENMSYDLSNLLSGVNVDATIKASNDNGQTWGPETAFPTSIPINAPPEPPESATIYIIPNTYLVKLDWTVPKEYPLGNSHYVVVAEPATDKGSQFTYISNGLYDLSYTFISLLPGAKFYFSLKTVNQVGESQPLITETIEVPIIS
jgi:predicted phage tail protein